MMPTQNGRYKCNILGSFTASHFYHYQASGVVTMCQRTFGKVPLPNHHASQPDVRKALDELPASMQTFGGFLKDQTGLGKTKQILLMLALRALYQETDTSKPTLILVPASLINQWIEEIADQWPGFELWLCYGEGDVRTTLKQRIITSSHLRQLPSLKELPTRLHALLDPSDDSKWKRSVIVLSSYETWQQRSTWASCETKTRKDGTEIVHKEWHSRVAGRFNFVVLDEGHKCKNRDTAAHASVLKMQADYHWIVSATPMQNSEMVSISDLF